MHRLKAILVTSDFSEDAHNAVRRASLIAARHQARMTLLHVVDPCSLKGPRAWFSSPTGLEYKIAVAQAALGRLAAEVVARHDLHVTQAVLVGRPLELICQMSEEADLLVVGSRRVNPLTRLIFGTPIEQLLRLVHRPVLMVKQLATDPYGCALAAVDLDTDAAQIVRSASALVPAASLEVLHALSTRRMDRMRAKDAPVEAVREVGDGERQQAVARLRALLSCLGMTGAQASVDHGDPARLTLDRQRETAADLIVLGKDGPSTLCNFLLGGMPQCVLSSARCDVLTVPQLAARDSTTMRARANWPTVAPPMALGQG